MTSLSVHVRSGLGTTLSPPLWCLGIKGGTRTTLVVHVPQKIVIFGAARNLSKQTADSSNNYKYGSIKLA
jgi:hypothetical protein